MKSQKLFTSGKTSKAIDDRDVYLMLIAKELCSHHNAHYPDAYYSFPDRIIRDYLKFKNMDKDVLNTALRKLDGYSKETLTEKAKKILTQKYEEERDKALEELLIFCCEVLSDRSEKISLNTVRNNHIEYKPLKDILSRNAVKNEVELLSIPLTVLDDVDRKINKYAKNAAKLGALEHVEKHIALTGEYNYRKLVDSTGQIFDLMFTEGKYSDVDAATALNNLKKYVKEGVNSYEIYDDIDFLVDKDSYYQTLYTGFKNKLKKISSN